ncbi:MAG: mandelate racemase/muconate lactonizing enzyme family protein [Planctomycetaceae bacterium]|nr:mandelate racemase/muconate lactonizing enzyme family protein [Planctomycetaceae bacterium]
MRIDSLDFFYLAMPEILDIGDGSQDALLVRIGAGDHVGWGECEAAPLVSIASLVCPMSHSACKPVQASVLGQSLENVADIRRIGDLVRANSLDLLQADHTLSGIDIALWDLLGHRLGEPVWKLLGYRQSHAKTPYASVLFGDTPEATLLKARTIQSQGFRAAKFGWGPFGRSNAAADEAQLHAAREGLGKDGLLLIDAGTVWNTDVDAARARLRALQDVRATWLEEPFVSGALAEYHALSTESGPVGLAGGEGCHNVHMARHMIDHAGLKYVQIDAGRIGGITIAKDVADYAVAKGVTYVNHTFTSNLALSASLQPFAGLELHVISEFPTELKPLAVAMTKNHIAPDANGQICAPNAPGLGMEPDLAGMQPYLVDAEIRVGSKVLYRTPPLLR